MSRTVRIIKCEEMRHTLNGTPWTLLALAPSLMDPIIEYFTCQCFTRFIAYKILGVLSRKESNTKEARCICAIVSITFGSGYSVKRTSLSNLAILWKDPPRETACPMSVRTGIASMSKQQRHGLSGQISWLKPNRTSDDFSSLHSNFPN